MKKSIVSVFIIISFLTISVNQQVVNSEVLNDSSYAIRLTVWRRHSTRSLTGHSTTQWSF